MVPVSLLEAAARCITIAFAVALAGPAISQEFDPAQRLADAAGGDPIVIAHRGCWAIYPENSIAAVKYCARLGVDMVEIDIQLTADGELVVFHDGSLERTTNGWGYLSEKTLAEIQTLSLRERDGAPTHRDHDGAMLTAHRVPTFAEVLLAAKGKLFVRTDVKSNPFHTRREVIATAVEITNELGLTDHVLWNIGSPEEEALVADQPFVMPIIWHYGTERQISFDEYRGENVVGFEIPSSLPAALRDAYKSNPKPHIMGISVSPLWSGGHDDKTSLRTPEKGWGTLLDMGATMIQTDRPELLLEFLEERKRSSMSKDL